jgi:hypothetical protein
MRCALKNNWVHKPVLLAVAYLEKFTDFKVCAHSFFVIRERKCSTDSVLQCGEQNVLLGDARLRMEQLPKDKLYDVIVLDAFTGGSVPIHLLTQEAFQIYRDHHKPEGYIDINITDRPVQQHCVHCQIRTQQA